MQGGGYILIHDYSIRSNGFIGVKKACDNFLYNLQKIEYIAIDIPETTHLLIKKVKRVEA